MEINPYQSPRPGEPVVEPRLDDAASIRQLLVEIRDAQRQTVELLRQSELRQQTAMQTAMRSMYPMRIIGFVMPLLLLAFFYYLFSRIRAMPIPPARAPIRAPR
jgi:hypothetical protein